MEKIRVMSKKVRFWDQYEGPAGFEPLTSTFALQELFPLGLSGIPGS